MSTYTETVNRYVVEYRETMTEEARAQYRLHGMDPDEAWLLKWSFHTQEHAETRAREDQEFHNSWCDSNGHQPWQTYRWRDLGSSQKIFRESWL